MTPARMPLVDLHAHLPMQVKLPERLCDTTKQTARNQALMNLANNLANYEFPWVPRFRLKAAKDEGVSFGSVLYVPSDELFGPCGALENLKQQFESANAKLTSAGYDVALNGRDFRSMVKAGGLAAFHCLEGGFSIERPADVATLASRGIAYITLAHLLYREIATCVNAFPFFTDAEFERMFPMPAEGLTARGKAICEEMCLHGIIPDITHMTARAACEVFEIARANQPSRPVIVSHGAPQGNTANEYKLNLTPDVIRQIRDSGGVIGVIFFDHWLLPPGSPYGSRAKIDDVVAAMKKIEEVAGTTDCIAIGSDFEGFIRPVKGLENVNKIRALEKALRKAFNEDQVRGIMWENAARTLEAGWE